MHLRILENPSHLNLHNRQNTQINLILGLITLAKQLNKILIVLNMLMAIVNLKITEKISHVVAQRSARRNGELRLFINSNMGNAFKI